MKQSSLSWICLWWEGFTQTGSLPLLFIIRCIENIVVLLFVWSFKTVSLWRLGCPRTQEISPSLSFLSGRIKGVCHHQLRTVVPESKSSGQRMMLIQVFLTSEVIQPGKTAPTTRVLFWNSHDRKKELTLPSCPVTTTHTK